MKYALLRSFPVLFLVFAAETVGAATLYLNPNQTDIYPGDTVSLAVRLDTDDGECVNVIDGVVNYEPEILPVDISRGDSIVPIWVEDPQIDTANQRITFAGGIPNGYCGRIDGDPRLTNVVLEILFQAPTFSVGIGERDGVANIEFGEETKVLLNDGLGTPATLRTLNASMSVDKRPRNEPVDEWQGRVSDDNDTPRPFSITLTSDKSIYNGQYFITFNTTDKQSGLDHYEVMEEPIDDFYLFLWGGIEAPWKKARSPYLLEDQTLNSTIRVKAVDKAGNEYIAVYVPPEEMRGSTDRDLVRFGMFVAGMIIIIVSIGSVILYRWRLRRYEEEFNEE